MLSTTDLADEQRRWVDLLSETSGLLLMVVNDVLGACVNASFYRLRLTARNAHCRLLQDGG